MCIRDSRKRRTRAQPQHRLLFGFFYVRGELVLVEFEINAAVGRAFDAAHLDLRVDEQKPLLIKQLDALFEFFDAGGGKTSLDAAALGNPVSYTHLRAHETPEHLVC